MACPCGCGNPNHFTDLSSQDAQRTLARKLIPVADKLRDLFTKFGGRPYKVKLVRTRWSGGRRGVGTEVVTFERPILPTPLLVDLSTMTQIVQPVGLDEVGEIALSQVSGSLTEEELEGLDNDGTPPGPEEQVYYEVQFPLAGAPDADTSRRRFFLRGAPMYQAFKFQWMLRLERAREERARNGDPR